MKKFSLITGLFLSVVGFFQCYKYLFVYETLTQYGKGYVWGSILLLIMGFLLIYLGAKKRKTAHNSQID